MFKPLTIVFTLFVGLGSVVAKPEIILYNTRPASAATFVATTNIGSENQDCLPASIKTTHVCINEGTWIFYPAPAWEIISGVQTAIYNTTGVQICEDLPAHLDKNVGSYRPAGDPAGAACSLNLYVDTDYASNEVLVIANQTEVPYAFNSAIRTGDCEWEFFMKENYEGFSECLVGNAYHVRNFTETFQVQAGDIKSIREGCQNRFSRLNPNHREHVLSLH